MAPARRSRDEADHFVDGVVDEHMVWCQAHNVHPITVLHSLGVLNWHNLSPWEAVRIYLRSWCKEINLIGC